MDRKGPSNGLWKQVYAAVWRRYNRRLRAIYQPDPVRLEDLIGVAPQQQLLRANTERFLQHQPAHNVLLWGARGTGKSSLIKALLNRYAQQGLRMVEVAQDDLDMLVEIIDLLRDEPYRFILYCDDLSFAADDRRYRHLKVVLEGSLEMVPDNLLLYATSNRRHLMAEYVADNRAQWMAEELHGSDVIEERTALSDRFGLRMGCYTPNMEQYLAIVDHCCQDYQGDRALLHEQAHRFSLRQGGHNGRTAQQFACFWQAEQSKK